MTCDVERFPLPSLDDQANLAEKHGLATLLFCPDSKALRHVFIDQETGEMVRARCNRWNCLYWKWGVSPSESPREAFRALLAQAGLPTIRFHDLRHSAATILLSMGVNIKVIQEMLGHSDISIALCVYGHLLPSMQQEAVDKWDRVFQERKEEGQDEW